MRRLDAARRRIRLLNADRLLIRNLDHADRDLRTARLLRRGEMPRST
jgi:hypothetical protein